MNSNIITLISITEAGPDGAAFTLKFSNGLSFNVDLLGDQWTVVNENADEKQVCVAKGPIKDVSEAFSALGLSRTDRSYAGQVTDLNATDTAIYVEFGERVTLALNIGGGWEMLVHTEGEGDDIETSTVDDDNLPALVESLCLLGTSDKVIIANVNDGEEEYEAPAMIVLRFSPQTEAEIVKAKQVLAASSGVKSIGLEDVVADWDGLTHAGAPFRAYGEPNRVDESQLLVLRSGYLDITAVQKYSGLRLAAGMVEIDLLNFMEPGEIIHLEDLRCRKYSGEQARVAVS